MLDLQSLPRTRKMLLDLDVIVNELVREMRGSKKREKKISAAGEALTAHHSKIA